MFFNKYPNTNFHEMNLDWIIAEVKKMHDDWDEFKIVNSFRFEGEWNISKGYPQYSIVDVDGFGYLAIKPVPIGIAIDNEDYWRLVANYTVLIADMQNRIVALENKLETEMQELSDKIDDNISETKEMFYQRKKPLNMKKMIVVGDSYAAMETEGQIPWPTTLANYLGLSSSDWYKSALGSTGFVHRSLTNKNFQTLIEEAYAALQFSPNDVTHIVVGGGANDLTETYEDITAAISTFVSYCKSHFPNATVYIGMIGFATKLQEQHHIGRTYSAYTTADYFDNAKYLKGVENEIHAYKYFVSSTENTVHPIQAGSTAIGQAVYQALMHGVHNVSRDWTRCADSAGYNAFSDKQENDTFMFRVDNYLRVLFASTRTITCNGDDILANPNVANTPSILTNYIDADVSPSCKYPITLGFMVSGGATVEVPCYITFDYLEVGTQTRRKIAIRPVKINTAKPGGWDTVDNCIGIYFYPCTISVSKYDR